MSANMFCRGKFAARRLQFFQAVNCHKTAWNASQHEVLYSGKNDGNSANWRSICANQNLWQCSKWFCSCSYENSTSALVVDVRRIFPCIVAWPKLANWQLANASMNETFSCTDGRNCSAHSWNTGESFEQEVRSWRNVRSQGVSEKRWFVVLLESRKEELKCPEVAMERIISAQALKRTVFGKRAAKEIRSAWPCRSEEIEHLSLHALYRKHWCHLAKPCISLNIDHLLWTPSGSTVWPPWRLSGLPSPWDSTKNFCYIYLPWPPPKYCHGLP